MRKVEVRFTSGPEIQRTVGTLAEDRHRIFFEYSPDFVAEGHNLSPLRLPFRATLFEHIDTAFGPLPGLFDDSLPDAKPRMIGPLTCTNWAASPGTSWKERRPSYCPNCCGRAVRLGGQGRRFWSDTRRSMEPSCQAKTTCRMVSMPGWSSFPAVATDWIPVRSNTRTL